MARLVTLLSTMSLGTMKDKWVCSLSSSEELILVFEHALTSTCWFSLLDQRGERTCSHKGECFGLETRFIYTYYDMCNTRFVKTLCHCVVCYGPRHGNAT